MGFGDTRCQHPVTHLSLWSWLSRFTLGMEEMRKVMGKQNKSCGGRQLRPFSDGGGQCSGAHPPAPGTHHTPAARPYLLTLHPCEAVDTGVSLKERGQKQ